MTPAPERKASVDVKEAARLMGVSEKTVRREIDRGKLKAYFMGRVLRITRAAIAEYVDTNQTRERF